MMLEQNMQNCHVLIPCAGNGSRFNSSTPKQYHKLLDRTVLDWTLSVFEKVSAVKQVHVICHPEDQYIDLYQNKYAKLNILKVGGETRAQTVTNGLKQLAALMPKWVMVHDAARCCVQVEDVEKLVNTVSGSGLGGILAARAIDTLKLVSADLSIVKTVDRSSIYHAQTPQMFDSVKLLDALQLCANNGVVVTDEASAMEYNGEFVQIIECSNHNFKVTYPMDLKLAEVVLKQD